MDSEYEQLAELETHFQGAEAEAVQELIKTALLHPNETFKHGASALVQAVKSMTSEGGLSEKPTNCSAEWQ